MIKPTQAEIDAVFDTKELRKLAEQDRDDYIAKLLDSPKDMETIVQGADAAARMLSAIHLRRDAFKGHMGDDEVSNLEAYLNIVLEAAALVFEAKKKRDEARNVP